MSNKTLKGASRDKDTEGVPSSGNGRIKDWGPSEQPGSAPRELGTRDQLASLGGADHIWSQRAQQGGLQPLSLSPHHPPPTPAVSPFGTPPQATQRPGVIPGRATGRPQGCQPKEAAVFNKSLGPEARPGNVRVSRSGRLRPAEGPTLGTRHPTLRHPLLEAVSMSLHTHWTWVGGRQGIPSMEGRGVTRLRGPILCPTVQHPHQNPEIVWAPPLPSTLQALPTLRPPPQQPFHSSQAKLLVHYRAWDKTEHTQPRGGSAAVPRTLVCGVSLNLSSSGQPPLETLFSPLKMSVLHDVICCVLRC